ncbi:MAG: ABC transporter ATP-binding protein [Candidatus Parcubacteria bacterium]|nr:ABC transporter ATP-binding protein [Burkholderiales bacterium]
MSGIRKGFGGRVVLSEVSLRVEAGEYVAIVGESGSGKSTLLNIIAGLESPDAGEVLFENMNLTSLDDDARTVLRRENFGFVFQAFHVLPHLTVQQNVGLPLLLRGFSQDVIQQKAKGMLAAVALAGRENSMPRELSGGELQRVAIARALVGEPKLVLADEPTGNLDQENARQVLELLREQVTRGGAAGILVTHSEAAAATCHRRYRLLPEGLRAL